MELFLKGSQSGKGNNFVSLYFVHQYKWAFSPVAISLGYCPAQNRYIENTQYYTYIHVCIVCVCICVCVYIYTHTTMRINKLQLYAITMVNLTNTLLSERSIYKLIYTV